MATTVSPLLITADNTPTNKSPLIKSKRNKLTKKRQSGSLKYYGKISDKPDNGAKDDYKKMENIRVIARFRPKNKREVRWSKEKNIVDREPTFMSSQRVSLQPPLPSKHLSMHMDASHKKSSSISSSSAGHQFVSTLDYVFDSTTTQKQLFYRCGLPMIMSCLDGYNATVFAYGQSGSGKTYTMMGPENNIKNVDDFGLVPRCIIYLFQKLDERLSQNGGILQDYTVRIELLQIYKSRLLDLLNPNSSKKLVIKTNFTDDSVFVHNLKSVQIQTVQESFELLFKAQQNRIVAGHSLNAVSSRSHMLIMINVIQTSINGTVKRSKLNFSDLAGSEDLTKALGNNPDPERKKEAIAINSSLSALTTAVSYLSRGQKPGFRDSPLTHILKDSLGGNSKTIMLVAVSPHIFNRAETIRTLRFAGTAKKVKNKAKINEEQSISSLKKRIKELERENSKLKRQLIAKKKAAKLNKNSKQLVIKNNDIKLDKSNVLSDDEKINEKKDINDQKDDKKDDKVDIDDNHKKRQSVVSVVSVSASLSNNIAGVMDIDDDWASDMDAVIDINNDLQTKLIGISENDDDDDDEAEYEWNDYLQQLNEYRDKLEKESEENELLQLKIDEKNMELEACNNKIGDLMEELNINDREFYDTKTKLNHLQNIITQYQNTYPSFVPNIDNNNNSAGVNPLLFSPLGGDQDDLDVVQDGNMTRNRNARALSFSRQDSVFLQQDLLQNLLSLHTRIENKMIATEQSLNEIRNTQTQQSLHMILNNDASNIVYENKENDAASSVYNMQTNDIDNGAGTCTGTVQVNTSPFSPFDVEGTGDNRLLSPIPIMSSPIMASPKNSIKANTLIYESADEKLSEWDLDVTNGSLTQSELLTNASTTNNSNYKLKLNNNKNITAGYNNHKMNGGVSPSPAMSVNSASNSKSKATNQKNNTNNTKKLKKNLYSLSKNEKKLQKDLTIKMKQDKKKNTGWCACFFAKPKHDEGLTSDLIQEYLKIQVRKELVKDKIERSKEKERTKALKKRMKLRNKQNKQNKNKIKNIPMVPAAIKVS